MGGKRTVPDLRSGMISAAQIVSEMREREQRNPEANWWPNKSDVLGWVENDFKRIAALSDEVAAFIARGYENGSLSFTLCDGIANGMYAAFMELPLTEMPD